MRIKIYKVDGEVLWEGETREFPCTLGRQSPSTLRVAASGVSGLHLEISQEGKKFFLRDLGSRNGTFLENEKISFKPITLPVTVRMGKNVVVDLSAPDSWNEAEGAAKAKEEAANTIASGISIGLGSSSNRQRELVDLLSPSHESKSTLFGFSLGLGLFLFLFESLTFHRSWLERFLLVTGVLVVSLFFTSLLFFRRRYAKQETEVLLLLIGFWSISYWTIILTEVLLRSPMAFDWHPNLFVLSIAGFLSLGFWGYFLGFNFSQKKKEVVGIVVGAFFVLAYVFSVSIPLGRADTESAKREAFFKNTKLNFWNGRELSSAEFSKKIKDWENKLPSQ